MRPQLDPEKPVGPTGDRPIGGGLYADHRIELWASTRYPTAYMQISKAGCTFAKNLMWHLDHDAPNPLGDRIHDMGEDLATVKAKLPDELSAHARAFVILREPMDRFLSLYFDKIMGPGHQKFVPLRQRLIEKRGLDPGAETLDAHRRNCLLALDWIEDTWKRTVWMPPNPHWAKQSKRFYEARQLHLYVLTLDGLDAQLRLLLSDVVPELDRHLAAPWGRNPSRATVDKARLAEGPVADRLADLYSDDIALYAQARRRWAALPVAALTETLPRAHQFT